MGLDEVLLYAIIDSYRAMAGYVMAYVLEELWKRLIVRSLLWLPLRFSLAGVWLPVCRHSCISSASQPFLPPVSYIVMFSVLDLRE